MEVERSVLGRSWRLRDCDAAQALAISQQHGVPELVGRVLAGRGVRPAEAASFLSPRLKDWLPDPSHLHDLDRAAERLAAAVGAGERVGVIGDYDVDGATSTALLARYLRSLGIEVEILIPDRMLDGYGPNERLLDELARRGCRLVVTLDTGTTAFAPLEHAAAIGLEVIVIDHHAAEARLPKAWAVVNPNRVDQTSPLQHLAAVGVTFMVLVAVTRTLRALGAFTERPDPPLLGWLDLVGLGTVCDVVPLTGLNRAFVHQGLKVAHAAGLPGMAALAAAAGLAGITDARQFGFALGPRINAGGRIGRSDLGARLLTTDSAEEATDLAAQLHALNGERQTVERGLIDAAQHAVEPQLGPRSAGTAGRRQGLARGRRRHRRQPSGRAPPSSGGRAGRRRRDREGLRALDSRLRSGRGGDRGPAAGPAAAGRRPRHGRRHDAGRGRDPGLPRASWSNASRPRPAPACRRPSRCSSTASLSVGAAQPALAAQIQQMAPYGPGNAEPRFALTDARVAQSRIVGDGHVSCQLTGPAGGRVKAIAFRAGASALGRALQESRLPLHLAGRVKLDTWQGREQACFEIEDAAPVG